MLSVCYLAYLYNDFLIQRLLVQQDPEAQTTLLDVSSTILSTVLSFGIQREHVIDIQRDFIWTVSPLLHLLVPLNRLTIPRFSYTAFPAPVSSPKPYKTKLEPAFPFPTTAHDPVSFVT